MRKDKERVMLFAFTNFIASVFNPKIQALFNLEKLLLYPYVSYNVVCIK